MIHRLKPARGFALLTVLWLIVALSTVVGLSLAATRLGQQTTVNRIMLARACWAAEACLAIAQGRWAGRRFGETDTIDLGQQKRCAWQVEDPTAKVNVNVVEGEVLEKLLSAVSHQPSADSARQRILTHRSGRPFDSVDEVRAYLADAAVIELLTVHGPGTVNANGAPPAVLLALPGLGPEAVERLTYRREVGRPIASLDELAGDLSPGARSVLLSRYADLARVVTFSAPQLLLTARGWADGERGPEGLQATVEVLVVPLPERLAVIRRRMW